MAYQPGMDGDDHEIDILYFDHRSDTIVALEGKRGNGQFDRGKRDSLIRTALMVRMLLKSYGEQLPYALWDATQISRKAIEIAWYALGDSNPCFRRERAAS